MKLKKIYLLLLILFSSILFGCTIESKDEKFRKVPYDRQLSYIAYGDEVIYKDGVGYSFAGLAYKCSGIKIRNTSYIYSATVDNGYKYFLLEYNNYGDTDTVNYINNHSFDVGLFRTNLTNLETELLYDFKGLLPTGKFTYCYQKCYTLVDSSTLLFQFNGNIAVFDIPSKTILKTYHSYDENKEKEKQSLEYRFNTSGDFYGYPEEGVLDFYEYKDRDFIYHRFNVDKSSYYVTRVDNYIITSTYTDSMKYYNCYNLEDGKNYPDLIKSLLAKEEENNKKEEEKEVVVDTISYRLKYYKVDFEEQKLTLTDTKNSEVITIDDAYVLENCTSANKAIRCYGSNVSCILFKYKIINNRLFIFMYGRYSGYVSYKHTPTLIIEYDLSDNKLYYEGYMYAECVDTFILTE